MTKLNVRNMIYTGFGPIDLEVDGGECCGLSGPSGAGKTLLLRALADLDPHQGSVLLDGRNAVEIPPPV